MSASNASAGARVRVPHPSARDVATSGERQRRGRQCRQCGRRSVRRLEASAVDAQPAHAPAARFSMLSAQR
ncbi:hypothetical protein D8O27_20490 [Burkholderia mallei]|uniref:Uncharacterized protein n=1 Tax=Burkholderia mallei TaxID=13373 RepID=A0AAX1X9X4_BURML|nr:hypothetical protein BOC40_24545 [Burkholderia pseudomallei]EDP84596.1 hypothetical protein BMA10399_A0591 [Burkholderia mallei ATCC 10399]RKO01388.1 hypothetical protein D8O31_05545 [Burkholderia mallei]ARL43181.1 hypothetical protein BOC50_08385 [Burkholderia pseudomallei]RKO04653.1 hypothetical protein D8O05_13230 [Burkholderia mallei]